ncbi:hypothetical protein BOX15_Mlig015325g1 [Macrostomum lignano]|uniref:Uncharacterized protein n=1 Tax=Macrostomum lignano TaxID=282301 RepID=A0A267FU54_9PLAT|nr:hypothetical protein BOX15_Mlig015325g1 [Macrostomum lignano]
MLYQDLLRSLQLLSDAQSFTKTCSGAFASLLTGARALTRRRFSTSLTSSQNGSEEKFRQAGLHSLI